MLLYINNVMICFTGEHLVNYIHALDTSIKFIEMVLQTFLENVCLKLSMH